MIEAWELLAFRASELWEAAISNDYAVPLFIGVSFIFLMNVMTVWSIRRAVRRSEERLAKTLRQDIQHEFERRQRLQVNDLSKLAVAAGDKNKSFDHEMELSDPLDEEGSSMEKVLSSMRRVRKPNVRIHAST